MLAMRTGDHFDDVVPYVQPPPGPGVFEPIATTPAVDPKLAVRAPVHLRLAVRLPAGRPARADEQALRRGRGGGTEATAGSTAPSGRALQTETVRFHTEQTYLQFSRTLRELAIARGLDLRESARLLGYVNVATADTMIACWEAKYHYNFWRPNHAIQRADTDGNPATTPDADLAAAGRRQPPGVPVRSLLLHGRSDRVAAQYFGTKQVELVITSLAPGAGPPRTYENLDELVTDVQNARVWGGLHYRSTVEDTSKYFPRIARDVGKKYFLKNKSD